MKSPPKISVEVADPAQRSGGVRSAVFPARSVAETKKIAGLVVALLTLAAVSLFSWIQRPPGQFEERATPARPAWWWMPVEDNPFNRPQGYWQSLAGVTVVPGSNGRSLVAVGLGVILHSSDGGISWKTSSQANALRAVSFVSADLGWAVGGSGTILHSADGGKSWIEQASIPNQALNNIAFATPQSGWAVGEVGVILHTRDGGLNWAAQVSGTLQDLQDVTFVTAQSGWAVGDGGVILHTTDGGENWQKKEVGGSFLMGVYFVSVDSGWAVGLGRVLYTADGGKQWTEQVTSRDVLRDVTFATAESGWVVGDRGTVFYTTNGGKSWTEHASGSWESLRGVTFATAESGWAVGEGGIILHTINGGRNWRVQADNASRTINDVVFATPESGWAVGDSGTLLHTTDGGRDWKTHDSSTLRRLSGVTFVTAELGWAVGDSGTVLNTTDGGKSWKAQVSGTDEDLRGVKFLTAELGWAVGTSGQILHTTDSGKSWKAQRKGADQYLNNLTFVTPELGWAVGDSGMILNTTDGGKIWKAQVSGRKEDLQGVKFLTAELGWAVGEVGTILHTTDGGRSWKVQISGTDQDLYGVNFVTPELGWSVGDSGTVRNTTDGGNSWKAQVSGTEEDLRGVTFLAAEFGLAVGDSGTILRTTNRGEHWDEALRYRRWPAPLFYVLVGCAIPLLLWSAKPVQVINRTRIEELVNSDSPVADLRQDKLGQRALVERLTRFIRNPNTTPPLVISLQAPWGMGKSSVMRMLESNLKQNRAAVTVWFNAWHHQKEDQLLAYLLETIQKEAIPPWLTAVGITFRIDLLRVRLFSDWDRLAVVLLALAFLAFQVLRPEKNDQLPWQRGLLWGAAALASWIIAQLLVAFKSNPEKLTGRSAGFVVHTLRELLTLPSLVGKADVRQVFASNLKEVVEALEPQRLVIFLDDLDRCRPDQVVQILEAVNFLSSAASCVIVLGADYEKVETLVAAQFEDVALREEQDRGALDSASRAVSLRIQYARNYLRKIVNLRLNLRLPEPSDYKKMLQDGGPGTNSNRKYLTRLGMVGILAAPIFAAAWTLNFVGTNALVVAPRVEDRSKLALDAGQSGTQVRLGPQSTRNSDPGKSPAKTVTRPSSTVSQDDWSVAITIGIPGIVSFFGLIYWFSRPRRQELAQDTQSFHDALDSRVDDICKRCNSPREVRRFLNYLRLVATSSGAEATNDIDALRNEHGGQVDADLVDLAVLGEAAKAGPEGPKVQEYYVRQCDLFGLDPRTFAPRERTLPKLGR